MQKKILAKHILTFIFVCCFVQKTQCGIGSLACCGACGIACAGCGPLTSVCFSTCMAACLAPTACFHENTTVTT